VLERTPSNYIAQPTLSLSTCPTFVDEGVAPRHFDLRPFVLVGRDVQIVFGEYVPYLVYLAFGEATVTGMALTLAVVYRPQWVATFDDADHRPRAGTVRGRPGWRLLAMPDFFDLAQNR
jgi:uncharacterized circularly permuted ATP-grasp superfamily protein